MAARAGTPSGFAPLRVRDYRRMWLAVIVSSIGTFLQMVAAPWIMLEMTGSPFMVALVVASLSLPRLFVTIPAGALADAFDRRSLLLAGHTANAVFVLLLAVLTAQQRLTPALLVGLSFLVGTGSAVSMPSFQTLLPDLVPRELVPAAVALNSAAFNVARAVGPALGGALVAAGLAALAFALNGVSYLAIIGVLLVLKAEGAPAERPEPILRAMMTGMRYVRYTPALSLVLLVSAAFSLTAASVQTLLPNVTADDLGLGAGSYGVLLGAFGAGALLGAVTREWARGRLPGRLLVPLSISGFGAAGLVFGLSRLPILSGTTLFLAGIFWVWTGTTLNATVQMMSPRWVRGRAMSLYVLSFAGMMPIGSLVAGAVAEQVGAASAVSILTGLALILGLLSRRLPLPVLADVTEPTMPEDWVIPRHAMQVSGSPVMVVTRWSIDPADAAEFFEVARGLRRQRYRTGARRWMLVRDATDPARMLEIFEVHDWEDHLRQHGRIDEEAAAVIRKARAFCRDGDPVTRHYVGIDLFDPSGPPIWDELLAVHEELHERDGSIPLDPTREPT